LLAAKSSPASAAVRAGGVFWRPEGGEGVVQLKVSRFSLDNNQITVCMNEGTDNAHIGLSLGKAAL